MSDAAGSERTVTDEERAKALMEQLKGVHAFDLAYETTVGLLNFGTQKMGLLEETRGVRDLEDARVSVELIRAILDVVDRELGDDRAAGLRDALAQMQLAYAHAVQLAGAPRAAPGSAEPAVKAAGSAEAPSTAPEERGEHAAGPPAGGEADASSAKQPGGED